MSKPKQSISSSKNKTIKQRTFSPIENPYWVWAMFIVFLICVFSVSTHKLEDDDFFWHLSTGKFITENGFIPDKDVFGLTTQNAEWIPFEWGSDVLLYNLYKIADYKGIFIFRSLIICLFFLILFRLLRKLNVNPLLSIILFFLLLIAFFDRLSPRPHIFTYLFLAILIYLLFTYKYVDREKYFSRLYFLPVLFLLWGNLHLGVITGILFLFVFLISEVIRYRYPANSNDKENTSISKDHLKKLAFIFIGSVLALFVNPHGIRTYTYAYDHTKMKMLDKIAEWLSPFSSQIEATFVITIYKILLFAGIIVLLYAYKKRDLTFGLLSIVFALYSLRAIRFIVDYDIIIIPMLAVSFNYYLFKKQNSKLSQYISAFFNGNITKAALIIILIYLSVQFQSDSFYITLKYNREAGFGISNRYFPQGLYDFMSANKINGNTYNNFDTGGYFKWKLPDQKVFIDSRNINDEIFNEYYSILGMQPGFQAKLDNYGIECVIFFEPRLQRYPNIMKQQITEFLLNNNNWSLVYWDDLSMLFVKNTPGNSELISKFGYRVFNPYTAVFNQKQFEANILKEPLALESEMKRKSASEPQGYFYSGMSDIVRKVMNKKQQ